MPTIWLLILRNQRTIFSILDWDSSSSIEGWIEQENILPVHVKDFAFFSLSYIKSTSWIPCRMIIKDSAVISSPERFLATTFLVLILESKSMLFIIWIELFVSRILMLSFVVSITMPIWFLEVLIRSSFFKLWTFYSQMISCLATYKFFLFTFTWLLFSVQMTTSFSRTSRTVPVLPVSAPEITLTFCPFLNLFMIFSKGSSIFSFLSSLSLQIIIARLPIT